MRNRLLIECGFYGILSQITIVQLMQALTFRGKQNIQYERAADPTLEQDTDVVVQVRACSICGSDLHPYHEREKGLDHGCVMGHEFTGEIVEVGRNVRSLRTGDRVISPFTVHCGSCFYCRSGLSSRCIHSQLFGWRQNGKGLHGGQADYVRVPMADSTLIRKPEGMSDALAILLGDILTTGFYCARQADIRPEQTQVVVGCGPVGLMAIWAAHKMGASQVFAIDQIPHRLHLAQAWGATPVNFRESDPLEVIAQATNGRGADSVLEVVGLETAVRSAFDLLRPGGTLSAVGVCTNPVLPFSPVEAYDRNLTYRIGRCPAGSLIRDLIDWAMADAQQLEAIFSHKLPLSAGSKAYSLFDQKADQCLKVLLTPTGQQDQ